MAPLAEKVPDPAQDCHVTMQTGESMQRVNLW